MPPNTTVLDTLDAIFADQKLTPAQRADNAAAAKAVAWRSALLGAGILPQTWTYTQDGAAWEMTVTSVVVDGGTVTFTGAVTKDGVPLTRHPNGTALWPISVTNPPTLFDDPDGTVVRNGRTLKLDLIALARTILASVVAEAVP